MDGQIYSGFFLLDSLWWGIMFWHMIDLSEVNKQLKEVMGEFGCVTGTLHRADSENAGSLLLVSCEGVPDFLLDKISKIPFGKGIAGVAAETREPVELCNLQEDTGGVAKEAAKQTGVSGSLAVPILAEDKSTVLGVIGVGKLEPYDFSDVEKSKLSELGQGFIPYL